MTTVFCSLPLGECRWRVDDPIEGEGYCLLKKIIIGQQPDTKAGCCSLEPRCSATQEELEGNDKTVEEIKEWADKRIKKRNKIDGGSVEEVNKPSKLAWSQYAPPPSLYPFIGE